MDLAAELDFAVALVKQVSKHIKDNLFIGRCFQHKADGSTVTEIDKQINRQVISAIKVRFPKDGILGEELSSLQKHDERIWVLDPLDGTFPFTCGVPTSMVLLALLVDNQPVLGVAYNPHSDQLFWAVRGQGAFVEDRHGKRQVRVGDFATLDDTPVAVTGSIPGTAFDIHGVRIDLEKVGAKLQILGSTGYEISMVGAGQFGAAAFGYGFRHDIAVGAIFVPEAGGKVTDAFGDPLDFKKPLRGAVCSNGKIHDQLLDLLRSHLIK